MHKPHRTEIPHPPHADGLSPPAVAFFTANRTKLTTLPYPVVYSLPLQWPSPQPTTQMARPRIPPSTSSPATAVSRHWDGNQGMMRGRGQAGVKDVGKVGGRREDGAAYHVLGSKRKAALPVCLFQLGEVGRGRLTAYISICRCNQESGNDGPQAIDPRGADVRPEWTTPY